MNSIVQSLPPSWLSPSTQGLPQPVHDWFASGALKRRPDDDATTSADIDPADADTVTRLGVSPVAHIQVSMPTTVALVMPSPVVILGFVSTCGAGMVTESMAALTRVRASI